MILTRQRNVRLEQGETHLAQGVLDIGFGETAFAAQLFGSVRETPGQILEHARDITASVS
jgi:hypothetical protein